MILTRARLGDCEYDAPPALLTVLVTIGLLNFDTKERNRKPRDHSRNVGLVSI